MAIKIQTLEVLYLSHSSFGTLPNSIVKLVHLLVLDLTGNCTIKRLPRSICKLQNLQSLSLEGCMELETLPKGLGKLINLQDLHITTKQSILPQNEFASLTNLKRLAFYHCEKLKFLFSGAQSTSLEELFVDSCGSLESLPLYILPQLENLSVMNCKRLNLSFKDESPMRNSQMVQQSMNHENPIQRLRMKILQLWSFPELHTLPEWIEGAAGTLQHLMIANFPNLKMLPKCLTTMTHLKNLGILECPQLLSLPSDMHCLTAHLEGLWIHDCPEFTKNVSHNLVSTGPSLLTSKELTLENHG